MVVAPEDYPWSSYGPRLGEWRSTVPLVSPPMLMPLESGTNQGLGYREYVRAGIPGSELEKIRVAVNRNQLTGGDRFMGVIERKLGRRVSTNGPGRPRKDQH